MAKRKPKGKRAESVNLNNIETHISEKSNTNPQVGETLGAGFELHGPKCGTFSEGDVVEDCVEVVGMNGLQLFDKSPEQRLPEPNVYVEKARQVVEVNSEQFTQNVVDQTVPQPGKCDKTTPEPTQCRSACEGMELEFVELVDGDVVVDKEDSTPLHENWKFCLVGCFTGRFPGMPAINNLAKGWGVQCTVIPFARGLIIFKFTCKADRVSVLTSGPYTVSGRELMLKNLSEKFKFDEDEFLDVPLWVKFHGVPLEYWNKKALSKIASKVGKPLYTDQITYEHKRLSYARILVEVNLRKKPSTMFPVKSPLGEVIYLQQVEFEYFPNYCCNCKSFSHCYDQCERLELANKGVVGDINDGGIKNTTTQIATDLTSSGQPMKAPSGACCGGTNGQIAPSKKTIFGPAQVQSFKKPKDSTSVASPGQKSAPITVATKGQQSVKICATKRSDESNTQGTISSQNSAPSLEAIHGQLPVEICGGRPNYTKEVHGTLKCSTQDEDLLHKYFLKFVGNQEWETMGYTKFQEYILRAKSLGLRKLEKDRDLYSLDQRIEIGKRIRRATIAGLEKYKRTYSN